MVAAPPAIAVIACHVGADFRLNAAQVRINRGGRSEGEQLLRGTSAADRVVKVVRSSTS